MDTLLGVLAVAAGCAWWVYAISASIWRTFVPRKERKVRYVYHAYPK